MTLLWLRNKYILVGEMIPASEQEPNQRGQCAGSSFMRPVPWRRDTSEPLRWNPGWFFPSQEHCQLCHLLVMSLRQSFQWNGMAVLRYFTAGKQLNLQQKRCSLKEIINFVPSLPLNTFYNQGASLQLLHAGRTHMHSRRESGPEVEGGAETKEMTVQITPQSPLSRTLAMVEFLLFHFIPTTRECQPCAGTHSARMTQWWTPRCSLPLQSFQFPGEGARH